MHLAVNARGVGPRASRGERPTDERTAAARRHGVSGAAARRPRAGVLSLRASHGVGPVAPPPRGQEGSL